MAEHQKGSRSANEKLCSSIFPMFGSLQRVFSHSQTFHLAGSRAAEQIKYFHFGVAHITNISEACIFIYFQIRDYTTEFGPGGIRPHNLLIFW